MSSSITSSASYSIWVHNAIYLHYCYIDSGSITTASWFCSNCHRLCLYFQCFCFCFILIGSMENCLVSEAVYKLAAEFCSFLLQHIVEESDSSIQQNENYIITIIIIVINNCYLLADGPMIANPGEAELYRRQQAKVRLQFLLWSLFSS